MTTQLIPPSIENYACDYSTEESLVLSQLNRETHLKVNLPIMLSGHLQGKVLEFISHMIQPKQVLEIGTYTGYSAICLAAGLKENGELHTIDINEELYDMCQSYFEKAGLSKKIIQHIGHAADIIPRIDCIFDLVFIDGDHSFEGALKDFQNYYPKIKKGGIFAGHDIQLDSIRNALSYFLKERTNEVTGVNNSAWYIIK